MSESKHKSTVVFAFNYTIEQSQHLIDALEKEKRFYTTVAKEAQSESVLNQAEGRTAAFTMVIDLINGLIESHRGALMEVRS